MISRASTLGVSDSFAEEDVATPSNKRSGGDTQTSVDDDAAGGLVKPFEAILSRPKFDAIGAGGPFVPWPRGAVASLAEANMTLQDIIDLALEFRNPVGISRAPKENKQSRNR